MIQSKWNPTRHPIIHIATSSRWHWAMETIPQLAASKAQQTLLGVRIAPDKNDKEEFHHLWEIAQQWQSSMDMAKVMHSAEEFGIWQMILRKLEYPLVTTCFMQQQCEHIMWPILAQGLPSARMVWSFPWAIIHRPWQWGSLNLPNLYTKQLILHIHTILKFGGQLNNIMGSLIQASWEVLQLEARLSGNVFIYSEPVQDYLTSSWLETTWAACRRANV